jgi:hypothetical protein
MIDTQAAIDAYTRWSVQFDTDEKALAEWFYSRYHDFKDIREPTMAAVEIPANYESKRRCTSLIKARKMLNALRSSPKADPDPNYGIASSAPPQVQEKKD